MHPFIHGKVGENAVSFSFKRNWLFNSKLSKRGPYFTFSVIQIDIHQESDCSNTIELLLQRWDILYSIFECFSSARTTTVVDQHFVFIGKHSFIVFNAEKNDKTQVWRNIDFKFLNVGLLFETQKCSNLDSKSSEDTQFSYFAKPYYSFFHQNEFF